MKNSKEKILGYTETGLFLISAFCLLFYGVVKVNGIYAQSRAIQELHMQWSNDKSIALDQSLWSDTRINEFEKAMSGNETPNAVGILSIAEINLEVAVFDGATDHILNLGVGRVPGTAAIGETGNLAIAGHRDSFFRGLKDVSPGDEITVKQKYGTDIYAITNSWIVEPEDVSVLSPTQKKSITLITCYPFYFVGSAPKRFIVRAELKKSVIH